MVAQPGLDSTAQATGRFGLALPDRFQRFLLRLGQAHYGAKMPGNAVLRFSNMIAAIPSRTRVPRSPAGEG